jgi:hypothetical protein
MIKLYTLILFSSTALTAFAQWNQNPTINNLICTQSNDQQDVRIVSDTKGGGIMSWVDFRNDPNEVVADIFAQRVNSNGTNMWTNNGVAVCTNSADQTASVLTEDGVGGTIITWQDWRSGNRDIYAQRIDSSGTILWTTNGVGVVVKNSHQTGPRIVSDGAQGAVIVWEDSVNGNWDIYAQRINNNGVTQWTSGGVAVCTSSQNQVNPKIETDGNGLFYIAWQDRRNGSNYDIYCQKLNSSGAVQWTANGVPVSTADNSQINPKMAIDNSGAVILAWQHYNTGAGYDVYAQRINSSGAAQWTANGIQVCAIIGNQSAIDMTTEDITDGAIITWKDARSTNVNIYSQKVDLNGNNLWTANGVLISNASRNQINPNSVGDGNGGAIVVWQDSIAGIWDVYSQRISSSGAVVWTSGGVAVGTATDNQTGPKNVSDGTGGSIFAFQDKRSGDFDIYAYKIAGDTTTAIETLTEAENNISVFPNPFTETTIVYMPEGKHNLHLYDLAGREILTANNCTNNYVLEKANLASGTYLLTVNSEKTNYSKLIIIR